MLISFSKELVLILIVGIKPSDSTENVEPSAQRVRRFIGGSHLAVSFALEAFSLQKSQKLGNWNMNMMNFCFYRMCLYLEELVEFHFC